MATDQQHHHIIPFRTYLNVFGALLVLTAITVAVAQVDFGFLNTVIAMAVASVKAGLVLAWFMHLKYDDRLYLVAMGTGVFFLILMWFFCWVDIYTRVSQGSVL
ncbi:MAG: cytochrome C oxidase subunit IV family protein [Bdellovibrionales bacterium]